MARLHFQWYFWMLYWGKMCFCDTRSDEQVTLLASWMAEHHGLTRLGRVGGAGDFQWTSQPPGRREAEV